MTEREELATRIETNPLGWLPVVGNVINVTFTPDEAVILIGALRTPAVTDEMVDALEEQVQYLNTNANRLTGALSRLDWEPRRSHVEGDRNTFVRVSERLRAILTAALAAKSSPAPIESSLPSGESDPSGMPDSGAGGTTRRDTIEEYSTCPECGFSDPPHHANSCSRWTRIP